MFAAISHCVAQKRHEVVEFSVGSCQCCGGQRPEFVLLVGLNYGYGMRNRVRGGRPYGGKRVQRKALVARIKWFHEFVFAPEQISKGCCRRWLTAERLPQFAPRRVCVGFYLREDQGGQSAA